jgi:hypothetical protein
MERSTFTRDDPDIAPYDDKETHESTSPSESLSKNGKEKGITTSSQLPRYTDEEHQDSDVRPLETAEDIVTTVIDLDDDPTLNPWTFRMFFIGAYFVLTRETFFI